MIDPSDPSGIGEGDRSVPVLSIVMPAYAAEQFIGKAIESIERQTFTDFELVIFVDRSPDETLTIARRHAERDSRIRVIDNDRKVGMCAALNSAIAVSRGQLVGRMDADDISLPNRFEHQIRLIRSSPEVVVVGSSALHINADDEVLGLSMAGPTSVREFQHRRATGELTVVLDGTALMRRDVFDLAGQYDPEMAAAPEVDLHCRMAEFGVVLSLDEPLLLYRLHPGSSVATGFFEGRSVHRYVAARELAKVRGTPSPSYQTFLQEEGRASIWRRTRVWLEDYGQYYYRAAGVFVAEGRKPAALLSIARAFVVSPVFVTRRIWQRRISPAARRRLRHSVIQGTND